MHIVRVMVHTLDIAAIEAELTRLHVPVAELCRRAGIEASTWQRWKSGHFEPRAAKARAVMSALSVLQNAGIREPTP